MSGVPLFFGGGISGVRVCGRWADSVISGLLADAALGLNEENGHRCALRQCAHRLLAAGCEVKRKMADIEGAAVRSVAIVVSDRYANLAGRSNSNTEGVDVQDVVLL